jgi:hypothetical protein
MQFVRYQTNWFGTIAGVGGEFEIRRPDLAVLPQH